MKEKDLQQIKQENILNNQKILSKNQEIISLYDKYTYAIVELFDYLIHKESPLFYTIVFDILTDLGFFSINQNFDYNKDVSNEIKLRSGLNIVCGNGCCRNIAAFYSDIFSKFYSHPLKICCYDPNGLKDDKTKIYGNHMINLTSYQDTIYGFDLINHLLYYFETKERLQEIHHHYQLFYKKYGDIIVRLITDTEIQDNYLEEIKNKCELFKTHAKHSKITSEEYQRIIYKANNFIMDKQKILESFLIQTEPLRDEIEIKILLKK